MNAAGQKASGSPALCLQWEAWALGTQGQGRTHVDGSCQVRLGGGGWPWGLEAPGECLWGVPTQQAGSVRAAGRVWQCNGASLGRSLCWVRRFW